MGDFEMTWNDQTSEAGALAIVATIRNYWWSRGHTKVDVWPVRYENSRKAPVWGVRSNLWNGKP